jgi:hypothetical protein
MINILFLAFEFPPLNRGGVHRSLAFVKWLPKFGINPIVMTLDSSSFKDVFDEYSEDENLGLEIRRTTDIIPIKSHKPPKQNKIGTFLSIYFSIYGNEVNHWKDNYKDELQTIVEKYKPEAVLATAPPFSIFPLALHASRAFNLPLILDFRDAWSQWRTAPFGSRVHYWANLAAERKYLKVANAVIATSKQTLADLEQLHPGIQHSKLNYIPNGYDGKLEQWNGIDIHKKEFTIGYVGSFYYSPLARAQMLAPWWKKRGHRILQYIPQKQDWLYRSPYFFFKAVDYINNTNPALGARIKIRFVGKSPSWLKEMISDFGLKKQVELLGEKSHSGAMDFQRECDLLFITSAKRIGGKDYSIAGKTFEYIQAQKPILAFVSEGAQKDLLEESGMALICNPDEEKESAEKIEALLTGTNKLEPNEEYIKNLSRESLTRGLGEIIKRLIQKRSDMAKNSEK